MLRRILTPLAYLSLAVLLVGATIVLVAYGRGYSYDIKSNRWLINGLLLVNSSPSGATVKINGKALRRKTPYRNTLEAGDYSVEVSKLGYRSWAKTLSIVASGVTWDQYILLFPLEIHTQQLQNTSPVVGMYSSPDRRHIAYLTSGNDGALWALVGDGHQSTKVYTPKTALGDQPAEVLSDVVWSDDGSHLLAHSTIGPKTSYILLPANGNGDPINLSDLFGLSLANPRFNPSNWRELYFVGPEGLRRLNVEAQTVSAVLADKVAAYNFAPGDKILYIQTTPLGKSVWSLDRSGHKQELIQSLAESDAYAMEYSNYLGRDYLAVIPAQAHTLTLYRDIFSPTPIAKVVSKSADQITFNDEGRYLILRNDAEFMAYDVDRDSLATPVQFGGKLSFFGWFDNYHLLTTVDGKLRLMDFDGTNSIEVDGSAAGLGQAYGAQDGKRLFWISQPDPKGNPQLFYLELKK